MGRLRSMANRLAERMRAGAGSLGRDEDGTDVRVRRLFPGAALRAGAAALSPPKGSPPMSPRHLAPARAAARRGFAALAATAAFTLAACHDGGATPAPAAQLRFEAIVL